MSILFSLSLVYILGKYTNYLRKSTDAGLLLLLLGVNYFICSVGFANPTEREP